MTRSCKLQGKAAMHKLGLGKLRLKCDKQVPVSSKKNIDDNTLHLV